MSWLLGNGAYSSCRLFDHVLLLHLQSLNYYFLFGPKGKHFFSFTSLINITKSLFTFNCIFSDFACHQPKLSKKCFFSQCSKLFLNVDVPQTCLDLPKCVFVIVVVTRFSCPFDMLMALECSVCSPWWERTKLSHATRIYVAF